MKRLMFLVVLALAVTACARPVRILPTPPWLIGQDDRLPTIVVLSAEPWRAVVTPIVEQMFRLRGATTIAAPPPGSPVPVTDFAASVAVVEAGNTVSVGVRVVRTANGEVVGYRSVAIAYQYYYPGGVAIIDPRLGAVIQAAEEAAGTVWR